ncbi:hypothetical protein ALC56_11583 [Trachymyrmex septentrionalis]|uniref:Uncharacterized protein n=1 Tax=Trachymyrmex septentrionalis TaxID=34720 RepID=A0A195F0S9_9HYME|nr:hypothetical protein ALC56_11583 [Trachymyrmex septentrionalis]
MRARPPGPRIAPTITSAISMSTFLVSLLLASTCVGLLLTSDNWLVPRPNELLFRCIALAAVLFCRNGSNGSYRSRVLRGVGEVDPSAGTVPIGPNTPPLLFEPLAVVLILDGIPIPIPRILYLARVAIAASISVAAGSEKPVVRRFNFMCSNSCVVTGAVPAVIAAPRFRLRLKPAPFKRLTIKKISIVFITSYLLIINSKTMRISCRCIRGSACGSLSIRAACRIVIGNRTTYVRVTDVKAGTALRIKKNVTIKIFQSYTCLSLSAVALPESKSTVVFEVRSGFSRILSMMNSMTSIIASTVPVIRHTLSVVPVDK